MAKRKWNRFLELFRLSSASPIEPPAESRRFALQSGLGSGTWGGSATQEEADAAAARHAEFKAQIAAGSVEWENSWSMCCVHNRWWRGEGSCPFCAEKPNG